MRKVIVSFAAAGIVACAHAAQGDAKNGERLIRQYTCVACHKIPGIEGPGSTVGPPLKHIAKRSYIGGVLPNNEAAMMRWLMNPPGVDPRTAMPDMGISEGEARDIAAYLHTLD